MDDPIQERVIPVRRLAKTSLNGSVFSQRGVIASAKMSSAARDRSPSSLDGYYGRDSIVGSSIADKSDPTDEAQSILNSLLAKRRILLMDINKSELRDAADAEAFGIRNGAESMNSPMILHIREALCVVSECRTDAMNAVVEAMLRSTPCLALPLQSCSPRDIKMLAKECTAFFVTEETEHIIARSGDCISECFIVVKGAVDSYSAPENTFAILERAAQPDVFIDGFVESFSSGAGLGFQVLKTSSVWPADYVARNGSFICSIPVRAVQKYVGLQGLRSSDAMECFLKFYRLWTFVFDANENKMLLSDSLFNNERYLRDESGVLQDASHGEKLPLDIVQRARICYYSPGDAIFEQGDERDSIFIILVGECSFCRKFPKWVENIPSEVSIGVTLYPGDFSFMDGEDESWVTEALKVHVDNEQLKETDGDALVDVEELYRKILLSKLKARDKQHKFGSHKNSLVATTRVESIRVSLSAVACSKDFFFELLRVAIRKYPLALLPDEEIVRKYHKDRIWSMQKAKIICKTLNPIQTKNITIFPPDNFALKSPVRRIADDVFPVGSADSRASLEDIGLVFGDRDTESESESEEPVPRPFNEVPSSPVSLHTSTGVAPARRMSMLSKRFNARPPPGSAQEALLSPPVAAPLTQYSGASLGSRIRNFVQASSQAAAKESDGYSRPTTDDTFRTESQKPKEPTSSKRSSNCSISARNRRVKRPETINLIEDSSRNNSVQTKRSTSRRSSIAVSSARTVRSGETIESMMQAAEETAEYHVQKYRAKQNQMEAFNRRKNARKGIMGNSSGFRGRITGVSGRSMPAMQQQQPEEHAGGSSRNASMAEPAPPPRSSSLLLPQHRSRSMYRSRLERVDETVQFLAGAI
jgi:hypothetical protein